MSGSYGLLNFVQSGNVNSDFTSGTIGYNYTLTHKDSFGAFYRFSAYHYSVSRRQTVTTRLILLTAAK